MTFTFMCLTVDFYYTLFKLIRICITSDRNEVRMGISLTKSLAHWALECKRMWRSTLPETLAKVYGKWYVCTCICISTMSSANSMCTEYTCT